MTTLKAYRKNFLPHEIPAHLAALLEFQNKQGGYFSAGFELGVDDKGGIKTWSAEKDFLACLCPIGQANGTGSTYALWVQKGGDADDAPVVVFGDEGGVHVVAENLVALLRILTFDAEPMIDHDGVDFYKDEDDHEPSDGADDYVKWLAKTVKQKPVGGSKEVTTLVKAAQKKYAKLFATWMKPFYEG